MSVLAGPFLVVEVLTFSCCSLFLAPQSLFTLLEHLHVQMHLKKISCSHLDSWLAPTRSRRYLQLCGRRRNLYFTRMHLSKVAKWGLAEGVIRLGFAQVFPFRYEHRRKKLT